MNPGSTCGRTILISVYTPAKLGMSAREVSGVGQYRAMYKAAAASFPLGVPFRSSSGSRTSQSAGEHPTHISPMAKKACWPHAQTPPARDRSSYRGDRNVALCERLTGTTETTFGAAATATGMGGTAGVDLNIVEQP